jgi:hypothetical protein
MQKGSVFTHLRGRLQLQQHTIIAENVQKTMFFLVKNTYNSKTRQEMLNNCQKMHVFAVKNT